MRCSVVFGVTLRLLVINISSSSPAINTTAYYQRCVTLDFSTCGTVAVVHRRPCWQHLACCSIKNRDFCLPYLHSTPLLGGSRRSIAMPFGTEKLEWLVVVVGISYDFQCVNFQQSKHQTSSENPLQSTNHSSVPISKLMATSQWNRSRSRQWKR